LAEPEKGKSFRALTDQNFRVFSRVVDCCHAMNENGFGSIKFIF
jgi:hypothetical protein